MDTADFLHVFTKRVGVVKDVKGKRLAFFFFFCMPQIVVDCRM